MPNGPPSTIFPPMRSTEVREAPPAATVTLTVNGERAEMAAGTTLADLLRAHQLDPRLVVVERNREILRDRETYAAIELHEGDSLELVHFVGGG